MFTCRSSYRYLHEAWMSSRDQEFIPATWFWFSLKDAEMSIQASFEMSNSAQIVWCILSHSVSLIPKNSFCLFPTLAFPLIFFFFLIIQFLCNVLSGSHTEKMLLVLALVLLKSFLTIVIHLITSCLLSLNYSHAIRVATICCYITSKYFQRFVKFM